MEPPPAATVWMESVVGGIRTPATCVSYRRSNCPPQSVKSVGVTAMSEPRGVGVHADHRGGPEAVLVSAGELLCQGVLVQRGEDLAVGGDPLIRLDDAVVEDLGEQDAAVEDPRPVLVGDAQRVAEAPGDDQHGGL